MIYPGEYPQPLIRTTNVQCPVLGGYITARLQVQGNPVHSATGDGLNESGYVDNTTMVVVENTGRNTCAMRLLGTNDYTSGPRENVGAAQTLVPSGRVSYNVVPRHTYLEVSGLSGTTTLRMQLSSRLRWDELGFDKTDAFYPPSLVSAKNPLTGAV
jgi:hypothetical protein